MQANLEAAGTDARADPGGGTQDPAGGVALRRRRHGFPGRHPAMLEDGIRGGCREVRWKEELAALAWRG